jgi:hypothetical protein
MELSAGLGYTTYGCIGDVDETWFRKDGYMYQLSVLTPDRELQDAWMRELAAQLTFSDAGPATASIPQ